MNSLDHLKATGSPSEEIVTPQKMDAALKAKWVEALRSGEYVQGHMRLRSDGHHCCLGVLCEVAGLELEPSGNAVVRVNEDDDHYQPIYDLLGDDIYAAELWGRNDGTGGLRKHTFPEIALYIEKNL